MPLKIDGDQTDKQLPARGQPTILEYAHVKAARRFILTLPLILSAIHFVVNFALMVVGKIIWQFTYEYGRPNFGQKMDVAGMKMQYPIRWLDPTSRTGWLGVAFNSAIWGLLLASFVWAFRWLRKSDKIIIDSEN